VVIIAWVSWAEIGLVVKICGPGLKCSRADEHYDIDNFFEV
jgi:hypothetical protein